MTVTVQFTVLAPLSPALLHCVMSVTGVVDVVVPPVGQAADPVADPVQEMVVTIVAVPVGILGVAALYVKLLVMVTAQVIVAMPLVPTLLHWVTGVEAALARFASNMVTANPMATDGTSTATKSLRGKAATQVRPKPDMSILLSSEPHDGHTEGVPGA